MITVALIGPDGAGKSTITANLDGKLARPVRTVYMGINPDASNHMLPTTRALRALRRALGKSANAGGPREHGSAAPRTGGPLKRMLGGARAWAGMTNRIAEEWYRVGVAAVYRLRGCVVVFDRHFYSDYHAYDIAEKNVPAPNRLHGWMLQHVYPQPDLLIYLDAPAEVLFARKGEGTLELLERRRHDYLSLRERVPRFIVVDAAQPLEDATAEVVQIIDTFLAARGAKRHRHASPS